MTSEMPATRKILRELGITRRIYAAVAGATMTFATVQVDS